jgi:alpha-L-fucosidase
MTSIDKTMHSEQDHEIEPYQRVKDEKPKFSLDWSHVMKDCPDWLRDAKLGIFLHWGPYSVPEYDSEWYSRNMYQKGHLANIYHEKTFGPISEFGYKDLYSGLTGERFDADEWISHIKQAGAKYIVPVAEHGDNFSLWDSKVNPVNSMNYGPKRDITGELMKAASKEGIKYGAALHHSWLWGWFCSNDPHADVYDPINEVFYGKPLPYSAQGSHPYPFPDEAFNRMWLDKCLEIALDYMPDMIYFDSRAYIIKEKYRLQFAEKYYEAARKAGKDVCISYKQDDFHEGSGVRDFECYWQPEMHPFPWQTDDKSVWYTWCHIANAQYKTPTFLIHQLCEVVSKNGTFLLNVGPTKEGTFANEMIDILMEIGNWLKINGEAIYGTRPFSIYGEGPTLQTSERIFHASQIKDFTPEDIRFTTGKDGSVYAIALGWPHAGKLSIGSLREGHLLERPIKRVTMLGDNHPLSFNRDTTALTVTLPKEKPCSYAYSLKIE